MTFASLNLLIENDQNLTIMVDLYLAGKNSYTYYKCLCSQLIQETENMKTCWGKDIAGNMATLGIKTLNLHTEVDGWGLTFLYTIGKYWWVILICLIIIICIVVKSNQSVQSNI